MTTMTGAKTIQVYRVYIRATPEAIWTAITDPEWTNRYGDGGRGEYDLRPGGAHRGLANDGMRARARVTPRGVSLPDPTGSRSATTGLRSQRQC
jgi:uncharacterized protein YndB with AHSA1/START domain